MATGQIGMGSALILALIMALILALFLALFLAYELVLDPSPAFAQAAAEAPSVTGSFILAFLTTSAFLVFTLWAVVKRGQALDRAAEAKISADFSALLLDQNPNTFIVLFHDGTCLCSDRLREWLDLSQQINSLDDLCPEDGNGGLTRADMARFSDALGRLNETGKAFTLNLQAAATDRLLMASGARVERDAAPTALGASNASNAYDASGGFDLVWFSDVSSDAADGEKLRSEFGALKQQNRHLSDILDAAPFPVWVRNADLDLEWVNAAYVQAVDRDSVSDTLHDQVELCGGTTPDDGRESAASARAAKSIRTMRQNVVIGGERRALDIVDVPVAQGESVVGFALDVTDAERTRDELHSYLDSHSETLNRLSAPVAIFAADETLTFFNSAFARLWQLPEDWLREQPGHGELLETLRQNRSLPEQADFPAWKKQILGYYTGLLEPVEEMWHLPDDTTLRVVTQPHPMGGLLVIFEDVSDRLALERSHNTLIAVQRETLDNLHESVAVVGSDLRVKLFNSNFAAAWGLAEDELASEPHFGDVLDKCRDILTLENQDWEMVKAQILGHLLSPERASGVWHFSDGSVHEFAVVSLPDGASLLTLVNVTASVQIEQALRERGLALETADRLKSEFVASMSYELRTPLNSILGFSEMLEDGYFGSLNERQSDYVDGIVQSSRQLRDLIDDILDLAVIEAGELNLETSEFDLHDMLRSVATLAQDKARMKSIEIRTRCKKTAGRILGDKRRIKHALYNVVLNAISFTPNNGRVTISASGDGDAVRITVTDTGVGILAADVGHVFEKFRRGSNASGDSKGVGLGLALVRSFIELHGGHVSLASEPGAGTTVTFELPRTPVTPDQKTVRGDISERGNIYEENDHKLRSA